MASNTTTPTVRKLIMATPRIGVYLLFGVTVLGASACGNARNTTAPARPALGAALPVRDFSSAADLRAASDLLITGSATPQHKVEMIGDMPFTVTDVTVASVLKGRTASLAIQVRQTGDDTLASADEPLLKPGGQELLFLTRFRDGAGVLTNQYVVTGLYEGHYHRAANGDFTAVHKEAGGVLPAIISKSDPVVAAGAPDAATPSSAPSGAAGGLK
jgi:hypothetical protein